MLAELRTAGVPVHRSWLPVVWNFHYLLERIISALFPLRMLWLWLRYRPDVIHSHTEMPDMAVWLSLRLFPFMRPKVVRTIHNTVLWTGMQWVGPRVERFMRSLAVNVAISQGVRQVYEVSYSVTLPIIYNGVELAERRSYPDVIPGKINVLFAGRFEEQKGVSTLFDIVHSLRDDDRYHFHIFGAGTLQPLIDAVANQTNVTVRPPMPNISAVMPSFDYLIMPSAHEGLGILAIEAAMSGLPPLINRCPGLAETLVPDWPLSVSGNDLAQWLRLFRNTLPGVDRRSLAVNAKAYADKCFSVQRMRKEYEKVYKN